MIRAVNDIWGADNCPVQSVALGGKNDRTMILNLLYR